MQWYPFAKARSHMQELMDECEKTSQPILIISVSSQAVLISKKQYEIMSSLLEGKYIISGGDSFNKENCTLTETTNTDFYNKQSNDFEDK